MKIPSPSIFSSRIIILTILLGGVLVRGQKMTDDDIKVLSKELHEKFISFEDETLGVSGRGVTSVGRKLIFQYYVSENWIPNPDLKNELIKSLYNSESHSTYVKDEIDLGFYYFKQNSLVKSINVSWKDLQFRLGDYIDLTGHLKSNGLEFKIKVPLGWEVKEGTGPHIVKTFKGGDGIFLIYVKEIGGFFSNQEVREMFLNESERIDFLNEIFVDDNFKLEKQKIVSIENHPFIHVTGNQKGERMGLNFEFQVHYWVTIIEDQVLYLGGMGFENKDYFNQTFQITNTLKLSYH
jgi:hypothetical protein